MRGDEQRQAGFIVITRSRTSCRTTTPLRAIRTMVDAALEEMSPELESLYAAHVALGVAPEYLLRAQSARSSINPLERRLCERLRYNLLLRWFVGLPMDEPV